MHVQVMLPTEPPDVSRPVEHYEVPLSYETATLCSGCIEAYRAVEARRDAE
jgi:hypothetical protein